MRFVVTSGYSMPLGTIAVQEVSPTTYRPVGFAPAPNVGPSSPHASPRRLVKITQRPARHKPLMGRIGVNVPMPALDVCYRTAIIRTCEITVVVSSYAGAVLKACVGAVARSCFPRQAESHAVLSGCETGPGYAGSAGILVAAWSCGWGCGSTRWSCAGRRCARWRCSHAGAILKACVGAVARSCCGPAESHAVLPVCAEPGYAGSAGILIG